MTIFFNYRSAVFADSYTVLIFSAPSYSSVTVIFMTLILEQENGPFQVENYGII
jgi:hypothetical protein